MKETFKIEGYDLEDYYGFVYRVTELDTGKEYIGQKSLWSYPRGSKSKSKRKKSNWSSYKTSNKFLKSKIADNIDNYKFDVLYMCMDSSVLNYVETKLILSEGALESDRYYNNNVRLNVMCSYKDYESRVDKNGTNSDTV